MLKKWKNKKIIERNAADIVRFSHLLSKASPVAVIEFSSKDELHFGDGRDIAPEGRFRERFFHGLK